jgi:hypothetical protein
MRSILPYFFVATLVLGCGGATTHAQPDSGAATSPGGSEGGDAEAGSTGSSGGADAAGGGDAAANAAWSPFCPNEAPAVGSPCTLQPLQNENVQCEYGYVPSTLKCDPIFECVDGQWQQYPASSLGACTGAPGPLPSSCPAAYGDVASGSLCPQVGVTCTYDPLHVCACEVVGGGSGGAGSLAWECPTIGSGCPAQRPRLGTACTDTAGDDCTYYDACDPSESCWDGVWITFGGSSCTSSSGG